jgi:hypothetical protein
MSQVRNALLRGLSVALICALSLPSVALAAPKEVNPETIHRKVLQRGVGNWLGVETKDGLALAGRITSVDEQSFGMQLHNYPEITTIRYADVLRLHNGLSNKGFAILTAAGVGGVAVMAIVGFHMVNSQKNNVSTLPTAPPTPVIP